MFSENAYLHGDVFRPKKRVHGLRQGEQTPTCERFSRRGTVLAPVFAPKFVEIELLEHT